MHEDSKLDQAVRFLARMRRAQDQHDKVEFTDQLAAFLSVARSVLQYVFTEAVKQKRQQAWYEKTTKAYPRIVFFKKERSFDVHERPVDPRRETSLEIHEGIALSHAAILPPRVSSGDVTVEPAEVAPPVAHPPSEGHVEKTTRFFLAEWTAGPEDAIALAELYLEDIRAVVEDGRARGFLTL